MICHSGPWRPHTLGRADPPPFTAWAPEAPFLRAACRGGAPWPVTAPSTRGADRRHAVQDHTVGGSKDLASHHRHKTGQRAAGAPRPQCLPPLPALAHLRDEAGPSGSPWLQHWPPCGAALTARGPMATLPTAVCGKGSHGPHVPPGRSLPASAQTPSPRQPASGLQTAEPRRRGRGPHPQPDTGCADPRDPTRQAGGSGRGGGRGQGRAGTNGHNPLSNPNALLFIQTRVKLVSGRPGAPSTEGG